MNVNACLSLKLVFPPGYMRLIPRQELEIAADDAVLNEREQGIYEPHILRQHRESLKFLDKIGPAQCFSPLQLGLSREVENHAQTVVSVPLPQPVQLGEIVGHHTALAVSKETTLAGGGVTMSRSLLAQRSNASRFSA